MPPSRKRRAVGAPCHSNVGRGGGGEGGGGGGEARHWCDLGARRAAHNEVVAVIEALKDVHVAAGEGVGGERRGEEEAHEEGCEGAHVVKDGGGHNDCEGEATRANDMETGSHTCGHGEQHVVWQPAVV